ncbi:MAG: tellurite resistance protein [Rhodothermales bacterium]|jgi:tellurite resistance protein
MQAPEQTSTSRKNAQDLALIFIALAYGADAELTDTEVESLTSAISRWRPDDEPDDIHEVVVGALTIFEEDESGDEVVAAIESLNDQLDLESKQRALEDAMLIAEADGLLLSSERTLISVLAAAWDLRASEAELLAKTTATVDDRPVWTLLHDIALLAIAIAHGSEGGIDRHEISSMMTRLGGWRSDLDPDDLQAVIRTALEVFSEVNLVEVLQQCAVSVRERLPHALRLIVLDDLIAVAESDGSMNRNEADMIGSLAQAWQLEIRIDA